MTILDSKEEEENSHRNGPLLVLSFSFVSLLTLYHPPPDHIGFSQYEIG